MARLVVLYLCAVVFLCGGICHAEESPAFLAPPAYAVESHSDAVLPYDAESIEHPMGRGLPGAALLLGGAFQQTSGGWDAAPTLAARYYFPKAHSEGSGPETLSPWAAEVGGVLPHTPPGSITESAGGQPIHAKVRRWGSGHLAIQYRWAITHPLRLTPDISLGVSVAQFETEYYTTLQQGTDLTHPQGTAHVTSFGPLVRLGLPILANDGFAFRIEVGYTHYPNNVDAFGHAFDLGISGLGIYPSLQIGLGYLRPGVEKGTVLPPSQMPLWVIHALQTEKKSPIIAPPEVRLHPSQLTAPNGLSGNVLFQYKSRTAQKVDVMGDFTHWQPEPMYRDQAHVWIAVKDLPPGAYRYVFILNGRREMRDPWNASFDPAYRSNGVSTFVVHEVTPQ